jgi:hypothetical protein
MRQIQKVPRLVLPMSKSKLLPPVAGNVDSRALARYFNKQYFQAFRRWPSGRYMKSIARQLNGRINLFQAAGRHATWYIPAVIGLYSVYDAPPEMRVRTLFEEGFAIVGGALGTKAGLAAGLGIVAFLSLGPLGLFVTVFICATGAGILGSFIGNRFGSQVFDLQERIGDIICHSPNELFGAIQ